MAHRLPFLSIMENPLKNKSEICYYNNIGANGGVQDRMEGRDGKAESLYLQTCILENNASKKYKKNEK